MQLELVRMLETGNSTLAGAYAGIPRRPRPHGDRFWNVRRRVPTVTVLVDRSAQISRWFSVLDQLTPERGLIISEGPPDHSAEG